MSCSAQIVDDIVMGVLAIAFLVYLYKLLR